MNESCSGKAASGLDAVFSGPCVGRGRKEGTEVNLGLIEDTVSENK